MKEEEEEEEEAGEDPAKKGCNRGDNNNNNVRKGKEKLIVKESQKGIAERKMKAFEAVRQGQEWR